MHYKNINDWLDQVDALCWEVHHIEPVLDLVEDEAKANETLDRAFASKAEPAEALRLVRLQQARELWDKLGDVPVNEGDATLAMFETHTERFPPGTPILKIWHWFEDTFDCSVTDDLMFHEKL